MHDVNQVYAEPVSSSFDVNVPETAALSPRLGRLKLPAAAAAGTAVRLSVPVTITNHGNVASTGTTTVSLYASTTQGLDGATEIASTTTRLAPRAEQVQGG